MTEPRPSVYHHGFDYLRALLPLFVIAIHSLVISSKGGFCATGQIDQLNFYDLLFFNVLMLAVPAFFLISLFLLLKKNGYNDKITRTGALYCYWVLLWMLYTRQLPSLSPTGIISFVASGADSVFYFFFSQLFLTLLSFPLRGLPRNKTIVLLLVSLALNWIMAALSIHDPRFAVLVSFWNPLTFLPCLFAARLMLIQSQQESGKAIDIPITAGLAGLFLIFCFLEWQYLPHPNHRLTLSFAFPPYARVSPVIGAMLLVMISLEVTRQASAPIRLLAKNSLGIYCAHAFLIPLLRPMQYRFGDGVYYLSVLGLSLLAAISIRRLHQETLI